MAFRMREWFFKDRLTPLPLYQKENSNTNAPRVFIKQALDQRKSFIDRVAMESQV